MDERHKEHLDFMKGTKVREFASGATRDTVEGKFDFEGFLSPAVLNRYAEYMNRHRTQADGKLRDSDNWQKGIPLSAYMKSAYRHFFDWWASHRKVNSVVKEDIEESLCGLIFNAMGYLHEYLKDKADEYNAVEIDGPHIFQEGGGVEIKLNPNHATSDSVKDAVINAGALGTYVKKGTDDTHCILLARALNAAERIKLWFYNDEIFPVEDN